MASAEYTVSRMPCEDGDQSSDGRETSQPSPPSPIRPRVRKLPQVENLCIEVSDEMAV